MTAKRKLALSREELMDLSENATFEREEVLMCEVCGKVFESQTFLSAHRWTHAATRPFQCQICGKESAQRSNIQKHVKTHRVFPRQPSIRCTRCNVCLLHFASPDDLRDHWREDHANVKVFFCEALDCGRYFADLQSLLDHRPAHADLQPFLCQFAKCRKPFADLDSLSLHHAKHRMDGDKDIAKGSSTEETRKCSQCAKSFRTAAGLHRHAEKEHSKANACQECGKRYASALLLKRHVRRQHEGVDMVQCSICSRKMRKGYLTSHMLLHSGRKPFQCDGCGLAFARDFALQRHKAEVHGGKGASRCRFPGCGQTFARAEERLRHEERHGGFEFACRWCDEVFSSPSDLGRHRLLAHSVTSKRAKLKCFRCRRTFSSVSSGLSRSDIEKFHTFSFVPFQESERRDHHARAHQLVHTEAEIEEMLSKEVNDLVDGLHEDDDDAYEGGDDQIVQDEVIFLEVAVENGQLPPHAAVIVEDEVVLKQPEL